jgi:hypothetical protein
MKKRINAGGRANLIRAAFYLLGVIAFCPVPFVLAQRSTEKQSTIGSTMKVPMTSSDGDSDTSALPTSESPSGGGLWNQYDNPATEPPLGIGSQDFEPAMAAFTDQAADDFVLPTLPPNWNGYYITGVRVMGEYSQGGGPASSFNVYIYSNAPGNVPGALITARFNLTYTGTAPDFTINFSGTLGPGTYWMSVQARQDFNPNGQWFWHNRTVQSNASAVWQNPGNGYGTGCVNWNRKNACMPDQVWPDQVFQILGFAEGPTPTPQRTPTPRARPTPAPRP